MSPIPYKTFPVIHSSNFDSLFRVIEMEHYPSSSFGLICLFVSTGYTRCPDDKRHKFNQQGFDRWV
jgi:hypothetical protein